MYGRLEQHFGEFGWYRLNPSETSDCSVHVLTEPANIYAREQLRKAPAHLLVTGYPYDE